MAILETGTFLVISILAFAFMIYSVKIDLAFAPVLRLISIVLFFAGGLYLVSGYGVGDTVTITETITRDYEDLLSTDVVTTLNSTSSVTTTETKMLITEDGEGMWIGFIYVLLAFSNMFLMYLDFFKGGFD